MMINASEKQLQDALKEARLQLLQAALELGGELKYGTLPSEEQFGHWDRQLLEVLLQLADDRIRASYYAFGISTFIDHIKERLWEFNANIETLHMEDLEMEADVFLAYQEGMRVTLDCVEKMLGEGDPMALYNLYMQVLQRGREQRS